MSSPKQKTIESFFKKYGVNTQVIKIKLLSQITDLVYDYNMAVINYEREKDIYRKKQIQADIEYIEEKIAKILK